MAGIDKRVDAAADSNPARQRELEFEGETRAYEPPRLRTVGTLAQLTRGVVGQSDGLGLGSALDEPGAGGPPPPGLP